eukprot:scaffold334_cov356-Prasinococcus_capsulatus_cf.AAC.9
MPPNCPISAAAFSSSLHSASRRDNSRSPSQSRFTATSVPFQNAWNTSPAAPLPTRFPRRSSAKSTSHLLQTRGEFSDVFRSRADGEWVVRPSKDAERVTP